MSDKFKTDEILRKNAPKNIEAEKKTLAAFLLEAQAQEEEKLTLALELGMSEAWFSTGDNRLVFEGIFAIHSQGGYADEVAVTEYCGPEAVQGDTLEYLNSLLDKEDALGAFERNLQFVRDHFLRRHSAESALRIAEAMFQAKTFESAHKKITPAILDLSTPSLNRGESLKETVERVRKNIAAQYSDEEDGNVSYYTIYTGIEAFDRIAGGFRSDEHLYNILAARPSCGKTSIATQICQKVLVDFKDAVIVDFQLENKRDNHIKQMGARFAQVNLYKLKNEPKEKIENMDKYLARIGEVAEERLFVYDSNLTVEEICARIRYIWRKKGHITCVFVDYLQLLESSKLPPQTSQTVKVGYASRMLKLLANEIGCQFFVLAQLSRASEKEHRPPRLDDLKWAGEVEQDADRVVFLHPTQKKDKDGNYHKVKIDTGIYAFELIQAKNKYGPIGSVPAAFVSHYTQFTDLERDE